jgi:hypothetical protein
VASQERTRAPVVLAIGDRVTVEDPVTGEGREVGRHERVGEWTLMAVLELGPTLWLAKATPRPWLEHGKRIAVRAARPAGVR